MVGRDGWHRLGAPALVTVLAVVVFAAMLALRGGTARAVVVVAAVAVGAAVEVAGAVAQRRASAPEALPVRWRRFWFLWSAQAGLTYLAAGQDTRLSAVVYLATGFVFALLMTAWFHRTARRDAPTGTGTQPLPLGQDPDDRP